MVQEDWVYHNTPYDSIEFESPILKPGDFVVWVRRDDVLAIQTALGGPSASVFHQACAVALTQSIDNLTFSTPCGTGLRTGEAVNQTGLNCSKVNDIAYGNYNYTA